MQQVEFRRAQLLPAMHGSKMVVLTRRHETDCGCNVGEPAIISTNARILA